MNIDEFAKKLMTPKDTDPGKRMTYADVLLSMDNDTDRRNILDAFESIGEIRPRRDGVLTELGQGFMSGVTGTVRGVASTLEELGATPEWRKSMDAYLQRNQQWMPPDDYEAFSLSPTNIAYAVGSGAGQTLPSMAAGIAGNAALPGLGTALMGSTIFAQIYGDTVKDFREAMPSQDEGTIKGLAFISAAGQSLLEGALGPELAISKLFSNGGARTLTREALRATIRQKAKEVGKEALKGGLSEYSEEFAQGMWDGLVKKLGDRNISLPSFEELNEQGMAGFWSGAVLGGAGQVAQNALGAQSQQPNMDTTDTGTENTQAPAPAPALVPTQEEQDFVSSVAKTFGISIETLSRPEEMQGEAQEAGASADAEVGGYYDPRTRTAVIDPNDPRGYSYLFGHEMFHHIRNAAPDVARQIHDVIQQYTQDQGQNTPLAQTISDTVSRLYEGMDANTRGEEFDAEVWAHCMEDPNFIMQLAEEIEQRQQGMGDRFIRLVQDMIGKLLQFLEGKRGKVAEELFTQYDEALQRLSQLGADAASRIDSDLKGEQSRLLGVLSGHTRNLENRRRRDANRLEEKNPEERAAYEKQFEDAWTGYEQEQAKAEQEKAKAEENRRRVHDKYAEEARQREEEKRQGHERAVKIAKDRKDYQNRLERNRKLREREKEEHQRIREEYARQQQVVAEPDANQDTPKASSSPETKAAEPVKAKSEQAVKPESASVPEAKREETAKSIGISSNEVRTVPVSDIKVDASRFQFKSGTDKRGVGEETKLTGKWDPKTAGVLYLWQDKGGDLYVVNGHHRLDLARRDGVESVNAIIDREEDGVTAEDAKRNGVLINIRDENGSVQDYATFVRHERESFTEDDARREGFFRGEKSKGRYGFYIGKYATDDLYEIFMGDRISAEKASAIAAVAQGDHRVEQAGLQVEKNLSAKELYYTVLMYKQEQPKNSSSGVQLDLFGNDDQAIQDMAAVAKKVASKLNALRQEKRAIKNSIEHPDLAKKGDVHVGEKAADNLSRVEREINRYDNFLTDHELVGELLREVNAERQSKAKPTAKPTVKQEDKAEAKPEEKESAKKEEKPVAKQEGKPVAKQEPKKVEPTRTEATEAKAEPQTDQAAENEQQQESEEDVRRREEKLERARQLDEFRPTKEDFDRLEEYGIPRIQILWAQGFLDGSDVSLGTELAYKTLKEKLFDVRRGTLGVAGDTQGTGTAQQDNAEAVGAGSGGRVRSGRPGGGNLGEGGGTGRQGDAGRGSEGSRDGGDVLPTGADTGAQVNSGLSAAQSGAGDGDLRGGEHGRGVRPVAGGQDGGRKTDSQGNGSSAVSDAGEAVELDFEAKFQALGAEFAKEFGDLTKFSLREKISSMDMGKASKFLEFLQKFSTLAIDVVKKGIRTMLDFVNNRRTALKAILPHWDDQSIDELAEMIWDTKIEYNGTLTTPHRIANELGKAEMQKAVRQERQRRLDLQKEANRKNIPVVHGDIDNIRESLPLLFPEQQDDVRRAEVQFFDASHNNAEHGYGLGYLFTNGTGTGKTYTGLGIARRFINEGKRRILVVTPSQEKVKDWSKDAKKLDINLTSLSDFVTTGATDPGSGKGPSATRAKGTGAVITTFQNFQQNYRLLEDQFDLVIYDESHRLMQSKDAAGTSAFEKHFWITNRDEDNAIRRLVEASPLGYDRRKIMKALKELRAKQLSLEHGSPEWMDVHYKVLKKESEFAEIQSKISNEILREWGKQGKESAHKTKVVFLSATPFNQHKNLQYVDGYIFSFPQVMPEEYISPLNKFLSTTFSAQYEINHRGKLQNRADVSSGLLADQEIAFNERMKKNGVMSGRMIDSEFDYSRDFPEVTGEFSRRFNDAYIAISTMNGDNEINRLYPILRAILGNYNYYVPLFEVLKTSTIIPRIKEHLSRNRKVVIFHRRINTSGMDITIPEIGRVPVPVGPPFETILRYSMEKQRILENQGNTADAESLKLGILQFREQFADLLEYEKKLDYRSPFEQLRDAIGKDRVMFFNGQQEFQKEKSQAVERFNGDTSGVDVLVVQEESGKEGISLHDTTGVHQRVLVSLSLPVSPITALQIEGRIFRIGNMSNAIFEYPLMGLDLERRHFANQFNSRLSTTENLALGLQGRDLLRSFADGVFNRSGEVNVDNQGIGGKDMDRRSNTPRHTDLFDKALEDLSIISRNRLRRDARAGYDYYATPEPLGYMMVRWADIRGGESVLEPSAGHGAIARYVPEGASLTAIEPSIILSPQLRSNLGQNATVREMLFEDLPEGNWFNAIVMNPPFGHAGKTAVEYVEKALGHLIKGGRIVALIPENAIDRVISRAPEDFVTRAKISLPRVTFNNAGTSVKCGVLVMDRVHKQSELASYPPAKSIVLKEVDSLPEFFENLRGRETLVDGRRNVTRQTLFSLRKKQLRQQINPIVQDGTVRDEYQDLLNGSQYTPETISEWADKAMDWFGSVGGVERAAQLVIEGLEPSGHIGTMVRRMLMETQEFAELPQEQRSMVEVSHVLKGTEWGREGVARRLASMTLDNIFKVRAVFSKMRQQMPEKARQQQRDKVLKETGVDIDNLPADIVQDKKKLDKVITSALTARASVADKLYEYWINAILSGPITHFSNSVSNSFNMLYELFPKRLAEIAVGKLLNRKDRATMDDFVTMWKTLDWGNTWKRSQEAFELESLQPNGFLAEEHGPAIEGRLGRIVRFPTRMLRAADEVSKSIIQPMEAISFAMRRARKLGLTGNVKEAFVRDELNDDQSISNKMARERAIELTFQEDPGMAVKYLVAMREQGGIAGTILKYMLPFLRTPANILRQGIRKSPLGTIPLMRDVYRYIRTGDMDSKFVSRVAEQILAWTGVAALMAASGGDDDDQPFITGTLAGDTKTERELRDKHIPPYAIKLGNTYYSYRRIEPLASMLALMADGINAMKSAKSGKTMTQAIKSGMFGAVKMISDKSYLATLGQIMDIASNPEYEGMKWGTDFLASWMPNAVRQLSASVDDLRRDTSVHQDDIEWWAKQGHVVLGKMGMERLAPRIDIFGRKVTKDAAAEAGSSPVDSLVRLFVPLSAKNATMDGAERALLRWNSEHPNDNYWPRLPGRTFKFDGKEYDLGDNYQDFCIESGKLAHKQILNAIRHRAIRPGNLSEQDMQTIKNIFLRARKEIREKFVKRHRANPIRQGR